MSSQEELINNMLPYANSAYAKYGILPSVLLAQALEETGGSSYLSRTDNNFFGMTWTGSNGTKGSARPEGGNYVHYNNVGESVDAYARLVSGGSYKASNLGFEDAVSKIAGNGYAANSNYKSNLERWYNTYNLGQYDSGTVNGVASLPESSSSGSSGASTGVAGAIQGTAYKIGIYAGLIVLLIFSLYVTFVAKE